MAAYINLELTDDDEQTAEFLKVSGASAELVGRALGVVTGGVLAAAGAVVSELGGIVSAVGEVLGWFTADENCNGLVFMDANDFTGQRIREI